MKRPKPLKRTPLKRSTKQIPSKTAKQRLKEKQFRGDGPKDGQCCELCGKGTMYDGPQLEADHIAKRGSNPHLVADPSNKRYLCNPCHVQVTLDPDWVPTIDVPEWEWWRQ